jgi:hypothetical protein
MYVASFVIADLLFVGIAIWRYRASKSTPASRVVKGETVAA